MGELAVGRAILQVTSTSLLLVALIVFLPGCSGEPGTSDSASPTDGGTGNDLEVE